LPYSAFDSGSPLIIQGETAQDDLLVGLVSWGEGCSDPNFPGVNARISDGIDFITENVCKYSANPPPEFGCFATTAPTLSPTTMTEPSSTTTTIPNYNKSHYSFGQVGSLTIMILIFVWVYKRCTAKRPWGDDNDTMAWVAPIPPEKMPFKMLEKRFSSSCETAYLTQMDSPTSTIASPRIRDVGYGSAESCLSEDGEDAQSMIV